MKERNRPTEVGGSLFIGIVCAIAIVVCSFFVGREAMDTMMNVVTEQGVSVDATEEN